MFDEPVVFPIPLPCTDCEDIAMVREPAPIHYDFPVCGTMGLSFWAIMLLSFMRMKKKG